MHSRHSAGRQIRRGVRSACEPLERRALLSLAPAGAEFRVNTFTTSSQHNTAVAADGDGDFVVVWESNQEGPGSGTGIYAQRYSSTGVPRGAEIHVNTFTTSSQGNPSVAMDADGDFVVAWTSTDAVRGGLLAQRFDGGGARQGTEFVVTPSGGAPALAMDAAGNFVVAFQVFESNGGINIFFQRFDAGGTPDGPTTRANTYLTSVQQQPSVAMDATGDFVVVWSSYQQDGSDYGVVGRRFDSTGAPRGGEFAVNTFTTSIQGGPSVASDADGDFVVAWHSYGQDGSGYGVYMQRYSAAGAPLGGETRANSLTADGQFAPAVAADADGGFLVTWEAPDGALSGVYARQFDPSGSPIGVETRVNTYTTNNQKNPAVAADHRGDFVVAWVSNQQEGPGGGYGVYAQRYRESVDTAGPVVTGVTASGGRRVTPYALLQPTVQQLVISFSETIVNANLNASWAITRNGVDVTSNISSITAVNNTTLNRPEVTLSLTTPLAGGNYTLLARDTIIDPDSNGLDGNFDGAPGGHYALSFSVAPSGPQPQFRVNTFTGGGDFSQAFPDVGADAAGNFVVVWQGFGQDPNTTHVFAQRYDAAGTPLGGETRVDQSTTLFGGSPSVAVEPDGDFVVAWNSYNIATGDVDIRARRFSAAGLPLTGDLVVNTFTPGLQDKADVAVDDIGNFVVVWESDAQDGSFDGIYGRRFNAAGVPLAGEFRANVHTTSAQVFPAVARDADGDFVVAWRSDGQDNGTSGVYARRYNAAGTAQGGEFRVNTYTTGHQDAPDVAITAAGSFVVTWQSPQDGSSNGIYAQRYDASGAAVGGEFRVNTTREGNQSNPSVSIDDAGRFAVAWNAPQEGGAIVAQRFDADGSPRGREFRVNSFTSGGQADAAVAMQADGDFVAAWHGVGADGFGIYASRVLLEEVPTVGAIAGTPDPVPAGGTISFTATGVADDRTVTSVALYRESNGVAGLQVGAFGDTPLGVDNDGADGWSFADVSTAGLAGTYTYWAQATDDSGLTGPPASTTNTVIPAAPAVTTSNFNFATLPQRLTFTFNQNVGASLGLDDIEVQQLPAGPTVTPDALSYDSATNTATFSFNAAIPDGRYRARLIAAGISGPGGALPADHLFEFTFLPGDADGDGRVNLNDFNILAANFGQSNRDFTQGDFDYSGNVNLNDFNILASRFGQAVAPAGRLGGAPLPPPSPERGGSIGLPGDERDDGVQDLLA